MRVRPFILQLACAIGFINAWMFLGPRTLAAKEGPTASPDSSIAAKLADADAALLASWVSGVKGDGNKRASTGFRVERVLKGDAQPGEEVGVRGYTDGSPGDLFLIFFTGHDSFVQWEPIRMNEPTLKYVLEAPPPTEPAGTRLTYFAKHLGSPEPQIAADAVLEFNGADFKDITAVAKDFPPEKLRKWLVDPETPQIWQGLYGMMLGACGNEDDAKLLEKMVLEPIKDFHLGIGGVMAGYLLLTGDKGLSLIDRENIENRKVSFSETFGALQALRFMWTAGDGRIEPDRLRQSMRLLLKRPELADLVVRDLTRWKDWSVRGRLVEMYDSDEFNMPSFKRNVVRYLLACSHDTLTPDGAPHPAAADAKQLLDGLRKKDPKTVSEAERFFVAP